MTEAYMTWSHDSAHGTTQGADLPGDAYSFTIVDVFGNVPHFCVNALLIQTLQNPVPQLLMLFQQMDTYAQLLCARVSFLLLPLGPLLASPSTVSNSFVSLTSTALNYLNNLL